MNITDIILDWKDRWWKVVERKEENRIVKRVLRKNRNFGRRRQILIVAELEIIGCVVCRQLW
jgi:hypothetical protein